LKGHIRKRGSKWCFVLDIGRDPETGKRRQKWFSGFATKKEAQRAMVEKIAELNRGEYIEPTKITVKEFLEMWLEDEVKPNRKITTYDIYHSVITNHLIPGIGNIPLNQLGPIHINRLLKSLLDRGISSTSAKYSVRTLKVALNWAVKMQLIPKNPAANIRVSTGPSGAGMKVWTDEEVNQFLQVAKESKYYPAFYLAITTGMRIGELLGLKWADIDFDRGTISIRRTLQRTSAGLQLIEQTKTAKSRRLISISPSTVEVLKKHRVEQKKEMIQYNYRDVYDLVFTTRTGKPVEPRNLREYFSFLSKKAGLPPIRFHDLRHTHATLLLQQGVHPKIVSERLGHSSISMTLDIYSHVIPSMQKEAAEMFDQIIAVEARDKKNC